VNGVLREITIGEAIANFSGEIIVPNLYIILVVDFCQVKFKKDIFKMLAPIFAIILFIAEIEIHYIL